MTPDAETAKTLRRLLRGEDEPEQWEAARRRVAECYHHPSDIDLVLHAADEILGTHGVEVILDSDQNILAEYLNAGDTYTSTLFVVNGRVRIDTLGDFVERMGDKVYCDKVY